MLTIWNESPFVRITVPFMAGILSFIYLPEINLFAGIIIVVSVTALLLLFNKLNDFYKLKFAYLKGILIHLLILFSAWMICILQQPQTSKNWYGHHAEKYNYVIAKVISSPKEKEKTVQVEVEIRALCDSSNKINLFGNALVYIQKSEKNDSLRQGDILLIKNNFKNLIPAGNPGGFNYAAYCATKNIFQSAYIKEKEWQQTGLHEEDHHSLFAGINKHTCEILKQCIPDTATHGIAEALLLGNRDDIDQELWQAYSNTGIVHIIAISGMHMAMIYGSVRWLLILLPFFKKHKKVTVLIAILFMWMFACVTGLPASVTRAAIMFTFIGWAEMQSHQTNSVNTLAAAAFCMLCYQPLVIQDVGFQLSYAAVLSLIVFYKPVYDRLYISNKYLDAVWKLIAMTLAAQVLTLPLCLYYFHQFPLLFLFTNLFAIPLTTIILYTEILLVLLHAITPVAMLLGKVIGVLIRFVNSTVLHLSHFSYAVWSDISISAMQMWLLFCIITCASLWLFHKRCIYFIRTLSFILIFTGTLAIHQYKVFHQQKIIVYNISKQKNIEFILHDSYYNPDLDSLNKNPKNNIYTLKPAHTYWGALVQDTTLTTCNRKEGIELMSFHGKRILRIDNTNFRTVQPVKVDILILSNKSLPESKWLSENIITNFVVVDNSFPFWKIPELKTLLTSLNIPFHITAEQGAFVLNI